MESSIQMSGVAKKKKRKKNQKENQKEDTANRIEVVVKIL
jgi:hypothetical protein